MHSRLLSSIPHLRHSFDGPGQPEPEGLTRCRQVHGDVIVVAHDEAPETFRPREADGLISDRPRVLGVQTADCLPTLFSTADGRAVAAVHAGWRGLCKGILPRAVQSFAHFGVSPAELLVAIGPAIGPCCFEVSREIVDAFERDWGRLWRPKGEAPWRSTRPESAAPDRAQAHARENDLWIDLEKIARLQLVDVGVADANIEDVGACTYCGPGALASYRRGTHLGVPAGRQWSWIQIR